MARTKRTTSGPRKGKVSEHSSPSDSNKVEELTSQMDEIVDRAYANVGKVTTAISCVEFERFCLSHKDDVPLFAPGFDNPMADMISEGGKPHYVVKQYCKWFPCVWDEKLIIKLAGVRRVGDGPSQVFIFKEVYVDQAELYSRSTESDILVVSAY